MARRTSNFFYFVFYASLPRWERSIIILDLFFRTSISLKQYVWKWRFCSNLFDRHYKKMVGAQLPPSNYFFNWFSVVMFADFFSCFLFLSPLIVRTFVFHTRNVSVYAVYRFFIFINNSTGIWKRGGNILRTVRQYSSDEVRPIQFYQARETNGLNYLE